MNRANYFPLAKPIVQVASLLKLDPLRIVLRAGLPHDFLSESSAGVGTPEQAFSVWRAIELESGRADLALFLARAFAHAPFTPAMFSFSCSPDVTTGLSRLAIFKPLMGPTRLNVCAQRSGLTIQFSCVDPELTVPATMAVFETLFILEAARTYTAASIVPIEIGLPDPDLLRRDDLDFIGTQPRASLQSFIRLSAMDAALPLISENSEAWPDFEKRMRAKLTERGGDSRMSLRAKKILLDMLPAGLASIEVLCDRLHMSRRSVQRRLKDEGESFQTVLTSTRSELAMNYLLRGELSVEEISHLLAYREPNSFYRAFRGWTGMTPVQARRGPKPAGAPLAQHDGNLARSEMVSLSAKVNIPPL